MTAIFSLIGSLFGVNSSEDSQTIIALKQQVLGLQKALKVLRIVAYSLGVTVLVVLFVAIRKK